MGQVNDLILNETYGFGEVAVMARIWATRLYKASWWDLSTSMPAVLMKTDLESNARIFFIAEKEVEEPISKMTRLVGLEDPLQTVDKMWIKFGNDIWKERIVTAFEVRADISQRIKSSRETQQWEWFWFVIVVRKACSSLPQGNLWAAFWIVMYIVKLGKKKGRLYYDELIK